MEKANIYVDGLNVYHRIAEYAEVAKKNYRWLDYSLLLPKLLAHSEQDLPEIGDVHIFISVPNDLNKAIRLNTLIWAWESRGLNIHLGKFKRKKEKQTDVNIALEMYEHAIFKKCSHLYLLSADSDLVPVIKKIEKIEGVQAGLITPPYEPDVVLRRGIQELEEHATLETIEWGFECCQGCSLPKTFKRQGNDYSMPKGNDIF